VIGWESQPITNTIAAIYRAEYLYQAFRCEFLNNHCTRSVSLQYEMGSMTESIPILNGGSKSNGHYPLPLKQSGSLDKFDSEDVTPVIGREFPSANIVDDFLNAPDGDALLRDLAITSKFSPFQRPWAFKYQLSYKSASEVLSSSAHKTISPTTYKSSSSKSWAN
jgi:hypothetical protein